MLVHKFTSSSDLLEDCMMRRLAFMMPDERRQHLQRMAEYQRARRESITKLMSDQRPEIVCAISR